MTLSTIKRRGFHVTLHVCKSAILVFFIFLYFPRINSHAHTRIYFVGCFWMGVSKVLLTIHIVQLLKCTPVNVNVNVMVYTLFV